MKSPHRNWRICINGQEIVVVARTFGAAVRIASRWLGRQVFTDHDSGGWVNAFGEVVT